MMKSIVVSQFGQADQLKYEDNELPQLKDNQVQVKLAYAGINPVETYIRTGEYAFKPDLPWTPGFDGAGVVEGVGANVTRFKEGDHVFVAALNHNDNSGTYSEQVVVDEMCVEPLGEVAFDKGASLGLNALTAYRATMTKGQVSKEDVVLINGASGGVGMIALQLAKIEGATVIATASHEDDQKRLLALGADHVMDHLSNLTKDQVGQFKEEFKPTLIIETLANKNLELDLEVVKPHGRIVLIGSKGTIEVTPRFIMGKELQVLGMGIWEATKEEHRDSLSHLGKLLRTEKIDPIVGKVFDLKDASKAHQAIEEGKTKFGKTLLKIEN
ncbi:NADPH:quinone reductase [Dolosicoccus paucivorans]|uniref:NADPH:quinone reductase n=1 Tax=Dolosicoccus paucivorans TaxID=84521 RepID=A0A1G8IWI3_9LACT|nr:NADPH:quinone reductase [Dolosicoccus paucivorans]PMB84677.1 NADPH:quinone reductase [Dolosicoccus paucivorans]PMC59219.1 NADPH:quinone reductase [Dolosicoccus paucivorans]SDI23378.1 NADPH:quinone reductase [Dolosicoccus paucivorans]